MYELNDQIEILRLAKVVNASQKDIDSIYNLYKKYLVPNAAMYVVNCNCGSSISSYYQKLLDWYNANSNRF